ncbi:MAG: AraC family transcriptional regulator [Oscillospiraceae bacterium]|nr:AraC family transcriptional regulator [Oscillospiraceae bacterium]
MGIDKELSYREFIMREYNEFHAPYSKEFEFYIAVKNGETDKVKKFCAEDFCNKIGLGKLSDDPVRNIKYHFVVTAALIARFCIEGGMNHETAYNLSDLYIIKADKYTDPKMLSELHAMMSADYTARMKQIRSKNIYSKPVVECVEYIYNNLHTRIRITDLAQYTHLNSSYLSRLFKKETGSTVTAYIQEKKIETAKNMLRYSDYLPGEISNILAFNNQSYFIDVFRKQVGMTPKKYRDMCSRQTDIINF